MSCGHPHATPCTEILALVYVYIDNEIDERHRLEVTTHLGECPPCEQVFAREIAVKTRVRTAFATTAAPDEVRARIVASIQQISVTYRVDEGSGTI